MSVLNPTKLSKPILRVRNLGVTVDTDVGRIHAVRNVSFDLEEGQVQGLVGESGCGKSITCAALMGLSSPGIEISGSARFNAIELVRLDERAFQRIRGRDIAMIFQDPQSSLNPVRTIGSQIAEALIQHRRMDKSEALIEARRALDLVQIPAASQRLNEYPHQLSGGMAQRAMIAMAISCRPKILIADEPTTALDATVQAQILALLRELRDELRMAMIIVTHDLGVVAQMADAVAVMYAGSIVEQAPVQQLFAKSQHPYTRALLSAVPRRTGNTISLNSIPGTVPPIADLPAGCRFHPRCHEVRPQCKFIDPQLSDHAEAHLVACLARQEPAVTPGSRQ